MAEQLASKALIALKQKPITNLGERAESTALVLMVVAVAALGSVDVWWLNQPTIPLKIDIAQDMNAVTVADGRPYMRKDELVEKKVVPQATRDKISDQITAKQT